MSAVTVLPEIPDGLLDRYERLAKATGRSMDDCMIEALASSIDLFEHEYGILEDPEARDTGEAR